MKVIQPEQANELRAKVRRLPVMEVFGPTIQGEGPDAGRPCYFVRFGGCDYRCLWCDSIHAVDPISVRANAERLAPAEIVARLLDLGMRPDATIVLSGGNPALHPLDELVSLLHDAGARVTVETQGTRWRPWLRDVDLVVVSPKPPSSEMETDWALLDAFVERTLEVPDGQTVPDLALKVVVGDDDDYEYAREVHRRYPWAPFYLSVLNPDGSGDDFDVIAILDSYRWLAERVASDEQMLDARVMPQMHTLAWGNAKGV